MILDRISSPADIRVLSLSELETLAGELRQAILAATAANGGHLASGLGAVELTLALHRAFNTPEARIIWDVGHQAYAHKLLTGRQESFKRLRRADGCAPFPSPFESPYDTFIAGHAGTAISAALGFAVADPGKLAVAVLGDGALSCGMSMEALNNIGDHPNLVVVLNDNRMSISPNVGALRGYFNRMISARSYNRTKVLLKHLLRYIPGHEKIHKMIQKCEETLKSMLLPSGFFEALGLRYYGPINGHSLPELIRTFENVAALHTPAVVHVVTAKGYGYQPAEQEPEKYHGVAPFDLACGVNSSGAKGYSRAFGRAVLEAAHRDSRIMTITAAMKDGTGLADFASAFPERFFDVGIAEEHAVTFAAGLAAGGRRPVVALYATFLQRALDGVFHDVCLQNLPVIFAIDRGGTVDDGPTHHGIYELGFLRAMPNLTILAPADEEELQRMFDYACSLNTPVVLRYPRANGPRLPRPDTPLQLGKMEVLRRGQDAALFALGHECQRALEVAQILEREHGLDIGVYNVRFLKPFDAEQVRQMAAIMPIFTLEDHVGCGGLASASAEAIVGLPTRFHSFAWPDNTLIPHGEDPLRREKFGMTAAQIAAVMAAQLRVQAGSNAAV